MKTLVVLALALGTVAASAAAPGPRFRESFDFDWRFHLGDVREASAPDYNDASWLRLNVPHDFSIEGEFSPTNASGTAFLPGGIG